MSTSLPHRGVVHLGLDVSKDWIAVGVLRPDEQVPDTEKVFHDEESVRRLIHRVGPPALLRACYEAGPTGYELHRLLTSLGVACDVIAPSMIPRKPGDKVKTDKRDCRRLARLHRAGELTAVRVPTLAEEGVRDVCRARQVAVEDLSRARHRLGSFLLRHSVVWRGGSNWSLRHRQWVANRTFTDPAVRSAFSFYLAEVTTREASLDAMDAELAGWCHNELFADAVARLGAYRGIDTLGGVDDRRRGVRLPPLPDRPVVHGVLRAGAPRILERHRPAGGGRSPEPATCMCAPSSSSRPGPTATSPTCRPTCVAANKASTRRWRPGRGPPSCGCVDDSVISPPANNPNPPSPPRSPANSPGSCGPNSLPRDVTIFARPSRRSTPATAGPPATRQPPADAEPIPGRSLLSGVTGGEHRVGPTAAHTHTAVPTRVHETGGGSIHDRLARPANHRARPPPTATGSAVT